MGFKAEKQSDNEFDHLRDTVTGLVTFASNTRGEMHDRFNKQDAEFRQFKDEVREKFDHIDQKFVGLEQKFDNRIDQLEVLIRQLIPGSNQ